MGLSQRVHLQRPDHQGKDVFDGLDSARKLYVTRMAADCTLYSREGMATQCHQLLLVLAFPHLRTVLSRLSHKCLAHDGGVDLPGEHAHLFFPDIDFTLLRRIVKFAYTGELTLRTEQHRSELKEILIGVLGMPSNLPVDILSDDEGECKTEHINFTAAKKRRIISSDSDEGNLTDNHGQSSRQQKRRKKKRQRSLQSARGDSRALADTSVRNMGREDNKSQEPEESSGSIACLDETTNTASSSPDLPSKAKYWRCQSCHKKVSRRRVYIHLSEHCHEWWRSDSLTSWKTNVGSKQSYTCQRRDCSKTFGSFRKLLLHLAVKNYEGRGHGEIHTKLLEHNKTISMFYKEYSDQSPGEDSETNRKENSPAKLNTTFLRDDVKVDETLHLMQALADQNHSSSGSDPDVDAETDVEVH